MGAFACAFASACSLDDPVRQAGTSLKIILEDQSVQRAGLDVLAAPTQTSDFNCFAINVSGSGINSNILINRQCSSNDNMRGRGFGIFSPLVQRGSTIELDVPPGPARSIDVYGIYPAAAECGGSASNTVTGYFLGSVTKNLGESTAVTIPIQYSGSSSNLTCTSGSSNSTLRFVPSGSAQDGKIYRNSSGSCFVDDAIITTTNTPSLSGMTEVIGTEYAYVASQDSSLLFTECDYVGVNFDTQVTYVTWDLSAIDLASYGTMKISWVGAAGHYSSTCNGATTTLGHGGGSSPPLWLVQAWRYDSGSGSQWATIGMNTVGQSTLAQTFTEPSAFKDASGLVWVRIVSDNPGSTSYCSSVQTDFVELELGP
ncbi:MAG: hypothetical protein AB1540_15010 [Bdellovibrionota bacterium]